MVGILDFASMQFFFFLWVGRCWTCSLECINFSIPTKSEYQKRHVHRAWAWVWPCDVLKQFINQINVMTYGATLIRSVSLVFDEHSADSGTSFFVMVQTCSISFDINGKVARAKLRLNVCLQSQSAATVIKKNGPNVQSLAEIEATRDKEIQTEERWRKMENE